MKQAEIPDFGFQAPRAYYWLVERGLAGFEPFTALQPWHLLDRDAAFSASQRWPRRPPHDELFAFARRQDCDDLACFRIESGRATGVAVIHGWTPAGYEVVATYPSIWDWLKSVVDDIAEWTRLDGEG